MPIDYSEYPDNWQEIRDRILKRAEDKCECCGVKNHSWGYRNRNGQFVEVVKDLLIKKGYTKPPFKVDSWDDNVTVIEIVLTIAHLDHDHENNDVQDDRLAALCQKCHLDYDRPRHIANRKYGKRKNQLTLEL